MDFELRPLTPDDVPDLSALMRGAFAYGSTATPPSMSDPVAAAQNRWGVFAGGRLQSSLKIVPFATYWGPDAVLPLGGIASVATWPDARGNGYVDALLRHALETMRDAGQAVSALYPFAWSFYRRYGWDWVGEKRIVTLPLRELRRAPKEADAVELLTGDAIRERLEEPYAAFGRRYRGLMTADTRRWDVVLRHRDGRTTYVYQYAPTGEYLVWRYEPDGKKGMVREWASWTPEGCQALLGLLHHLGTQCDTAEVTLSMDALLAQFVMHWDMVTKLEPVYMARVVDLAAVFRHLSAPFASSGSFRLAVRDDHAAWNNGVWRVTLDSGTAACEAVIGGAAEADIEMDIQALSQAVWGMPPLDAVRAAGRVLVRSEAAYRLLQTLLPSATVFTLDDF